jgi:hypothetical protein
MKGEIDKQLNRMRQKRNAKKLIQKQKKQRGERHQTTTLQN